MSVTFHKMHGLGNDFVLLDLRHQNFPINENLARQLSDRHTGVGCDQILVLRHPSNDRQLADFEFWNSDGSRAEQCGNGVRCLAHYLNMRSETPAGPFKLSGVAGLVTVECLDNALIRVDMGKPVFAAQRIPVSVEAVDGWYDLEIEGENRSLGAVSMGNPHSLMVVDDLDDTDVAGLGAAINAHPAFPEGCNAGFAEITDRSNIRLRVFERGAGETNACGSGSCAAVSVLRRANLVDQTVNVTQRGGILIISWTGGEESVIMKGPATHVFKGTFA